MLHCKCGQCSCSCYLHSFISAHSTALLTTRHTHANPCAGFYADCTYPRLGECPVSFLPTIRNWYGTILTARQMKCQFNVYYLDASPWSINWLHYQFSFIIRYSSKSDEEICGSCPHHHANPLSHRHSSTFSLILPCFLCFPHILLTSQRS